MSASIRRGRHGVGTRDFVGLRRREPLNVVVLKCLREHRRVLVPLVVPLALSPVEDVVAARPLGPLRVVVHLYVEACLGTGNNPSYSVTGDALDYFAYPSQIAGYLPAVKASAYRHVFNGCLRRPNDLVRVS